MNFNNSYRIHLSLMEKYNPGRRPTTMVEGIKKAARAFLQRGSKVRMQAPSHPSQVRDMTSVYDTGCRKRERSDAKGLTTTTPRAAPLEDVSSERYKLRNQQKKNASKRYQSVRTLRMGQVSSQKVLGY